MERLAGARGPLTVVVGAGMGGVVAARLLRERLPRDHRVLVIDRRPEVSWPPAYLRVVAGERRPQQITRRLSGLTRLGLEFRCAEVMSLDPARRTLEVAGDRVTAEAIVLAPGARLVGDKPPGASGVAHHFQELDAALRLRDALKAFKGGRVLLVAAGTHYRGPASLHEAALLIHGLLEDKPGTRVTMVTPEPGPMPFVGPDAAAALRGLYQEKGIATRYDARAARVHSPTSTPAGSPPSAAVAGELELEGGERLPFDLLVMIPPHAAPAFLTRSGLLGAHGWVQVDRETLATAHDRVWALGDVVHIATSNGASLPRLGALAEAMGETVAHEVASQLLKGGERKRFTGRAAFEIANGEDGATAVEADFFAGAIGLSPAQRAAWWGRTAEGDWGRRY